MRYVILQHDFPESHNRDRHWDLMLERDGVLLTWALDREPMLGSISNATKLSDHRLDYLRYEGPVSGDRGRVTRWDVGTYTCEDPTARRFIVRLAGKKLPNVVACLDGLAADGIANWRCRWFGPENCRTR